MQKIKNLTKEESIINEEVANLIGKHNATNKSILELETKLGLTSLKKVENATSAVQVPDS